MALPSAGFGQDSGPPLVTVESWDAAGLSSAAEQATAHETVELFAEDCVGVRLSAVPPALARKATCVHLQACQCTAMDADASAWPLLVQLVAQECELPSGAWAGLSLPGLQSLDLSLSTIGGLSCDDDDDDDDDDGSTSATDAPPLRAVVPGLLRLVLAGCELTDASATSGLAPCLPSSTAELDLSENDGIEDPSTLLALAAAVPGLACLGLSGTGLDEAGVSKAAAVEAWPRLASLNGASLSGGALRRTKAAGSAGGASAVTMGDAASCSCLEGEPCVDPDNCVNWADRFKIAAYVRKHGRPGHA